MKKGKITLVLIAVILLFGLTKLIRADIVEISVETDKLTYLLDEEVVVSITAYNPNTEPVTLNFSSTLQASYCMDDIYDYKDYYGGHAIPTTQYIQPLSDYTWTIIHRISDMEIYKPEIGEHNVIGEVIGYGQSTPFDFRVIPEPATLSLMFMGMFGIRAR